MSFRLVPLTKGAAPVIAIHRPVLMVGRHLECDVRIDQPKVSRRHCCFAMAYDRVLVRNLGSRNKVRVNGKVVDEARLEPGDEVAIGPLLYRLEAARGASATPPGNPPVSKAAPPTVALAPPPPPLIVPPAVGDWNLDDADSDLIPLDDL